MKIESIYSAWVHASSLEILVEKLSGFFGALPSDYTSWIQECTQKETIVVTTPSLWVLELKCFVPGQSYGIRWFNDPDLLQHELEFRLDLPVTIEAAFIRVFFEGVHFRTDRTMLSISNLLSGCNPCFISLADVNAGIITSTMSDTSIINTVYASNPAVVNILLGRKHTGLHTLEFRLWGPYVPPNWSPMHIDINAIGTLHSDYREEIPLVLNMRKPGWEFPTLPALAIGVQADGVNLATGKLVQSYIEELQNLEDHLRRTPSY